MDRLQALIVAFALAGCDEHADKGGDPPSRVNGAKTTVGQAATTAAFCDVHATADKAALFHWPGLVEAPPVSSSGWRWINVWATWCNPCIEEMPRIQKWRSKLAASGRSIDLAFISVDESADDITAFRKLHPGTPASARIADSKTQEAWFAQLGLTGSPPIPIHIFVDSQNRIRCARAGGVRDQDFAVVERLLAE